MADDVSSEEKKARLQKVEALQEQIASEVSIALHGQTVEVLVEGQNKGKWQGRTRTNRLVFFKDDRSWLGKLALIRIEKTSPWSLQGSLFSKHSPFQHSQVSGTTSPLPEAKTRAGHD
jgi:tRNA-2-methylthio-N6-dimethylallyladenosine synthase